MLTWVRTVRSLITKESAISWLERPRATLIKTSISRSVKGSSAGGSEDSYTKEGVHYYHVREFLITFERIAALCGMNYIPPFVVHQTSDLDSAQGISVYSDLYKKVLILLRDEGVDINAMNEFKYINEFILDQFESWSV